MSAQPAYDPTTEAVPVPWKWTRELYYLAGEYGFFRPDQRTELLEGEVFVKVSPQRTPHATAIGLMHEALQTSVSNGFHIRVQAPIVLNDLSEPEPDLALVRGKVRDYLRSHPMPQDVELVVEVADSSLTADLGRKARLYAHARIPNYWVVNLLQGTLEVFQNPGLDGYQDRHTYVPGALVTATCLLRDLSVVDLLPGSGSTG